jgi:cell division protein FtsQ
MRKSFFWLFIFFILLTTYKPKFTFFPNISMNIKEVIIEKNSILHLDEIMQKLNYLYEENLFFLNLKFLEKNLRKITFIESFKIKKIYPNTLKIIIKEQEPVAISQVRKNKFFISDKGELIDFRYVKIYDDLPTVFGGVKNFPSLFKELQKIGFPIEKIKSFYFFESGRWDLIMRDNKIIKLPNDNYLSSLENFMKSKNNINLKTYKIFDYRIKNQLILK